MEAEIAVAPVQGPRFVGGGVAQAGDREAGPFRPEVLAPRGTALDDREVSWGGFAVDADLVAGVLGHPRKAPPPHPCDVQFRQGQSDHQPSMGVGCGVERVECDVEALLATPVRFMVGFGRHKPNQLVQVLVGGSEDGAVVVGPDPEHQPFAVSV